MGGVFLLRGKISSSFNRKMHHGASFDYYLFTGKTRSPNLHRKSDVASIGEMEVLKKPTLVLASV